MCRSFVSRSFVSRGFILLCGAGLLLLARPSSAQMTVTGPATPTAHALAAWSRQHIPARFQAHDKVEVQALSDAAMDDYLHADSDSDTDSSNDANNNDANHDGNSENSAEEIDGVFTDNPPQITLRVSDPAQIDYATFAHEYGHYVWFDLLTKEDRKRYKTIYERQKAAHRLITSYAAESLEEGFAEAFSADLVTPAALLHQDPLSYQFLSRWPKEQ